MDTPKKPNKFIVAAFIVAIIAAIILVIAIILLIQKTTTSPLDPTQPGTDSADVNVSQDPERDNHITDPASIAQKLLDTNSADPTIRQLSTIYTALEAGNTGSAGNYLSNIDPSSLEGDTVIFYYYDSYLYNSAIGNSDAAASAKLEIDRQSTKSHSED